MSDHYCWENHAPHCKHMLKKKNEYTPDGKAVWYCEKTVYNTILRVSMCMKDVGCESWEPVDSPKKETITHDRFTQIEIE